MAVASTLLDKAEKTLDFQRDAVGVPGLESTQLLSVLNQAVLDYHSSFEKGGGEPNSILRKEKGYTLVDDDALNGAIAASAASIILDDSSGFGTSGAIALWGSKRPEYSEFTGNNLTTTLSGVTGVDFAHADDSVVSLLYALPANFDTMRSEEGYEEGVSVEGKPYFFTSGTPFGNRYAIYDNGTTKYLHFPQGSSGKVFVRYNALPTTVSAEGSTIDIPTKDLDYGVWCVVEYAAPKLERMDMFQLAQQKKLQMLSSAHIRRNIGKRPRFGRPVNPRRSTLSRSDVFDG